MKKTAKLFSGLMLIAALSFVGFSSFTAPDAAVSNTPEAAVVVDDCGCPPGWTLTKEGKDLKGNEKYDNNMDGRICYKWLDEELQKKGKGEGNSLNNRGVVVKDNNKKPCNN